VQHALLDILEALCGLLVHKVSLGKGKSGLGGTTKDIEAGVVGSCLSLCALCGKHFPIFILYGIIHSRGLTTESTGVTERDQLRNSAFFYPNTFGYTRALGSLGIKSLIIA